MTPAPEARDRARPPSDIVIFFPPGAARLADAHCTVSGRHATPCRITLHHGAQSVEVAGLTLATAARTAERPVVVRLSMRDGSAWLKVGPGESVATPDLGDIFECPAIDAAPGISLDRIAPPVDEPLLLRRGLATVHDRAGAVDHVSRTGGITGWIVDLTRPADPHDIELRCGDMVLARTRADRPRPNTAPRVAEAPLGRFSLPWSEIDRDQLERCATTTPDAAVSLHVPALGTQLDNVYRPISAGTALALAGPMLALSVPAGGPQISLDAPRVSAIIPNYNYAHYLPERIGSLLAQDTPLELILLDDASTDTSIDVALATARAAAHELQIVTSPRNSGSVLPQWRGATMLARGRYLLIAEADDVAEPTLVSTLAAKLDAHPDMVFAFSDSAEIDADGAIARPDYKAYYAALGDRALEREQVMPADKFLLRFLLPRNLVVNVSAVLWRTAALRAAFERLGSAIDDFRAAGDWRVYVEACRAGGSVGYAPAPLNRFRRHPGSVIGRYTRAQHIAEVEAIHALLLSLCGGEPGVDERLAHHRAALRHLWSLAPIIDDAGGTP